MCLFKIGHFSPTVCSAAMAKRISTRFRRRTSHSEIKTYDESYCQDAIDRVVFNFSELVEEILRNQDPWKSVAGEDRPGQPGKETFLLGSFASTDYSKLDYDRVWSSQEWKAEATTIDQGNLRKLHGEWYNKFDLITKKILLDGTAQSVRYGEPLRDRSGQPDNINFQEVADSANFVMGNDTTELELLRMFREM